MVAEGCGAKAQNSGAGAGWEKRTILGNDSEDSDTIIVKVEPTGPGGFHDATRWLDPSAWSDRRGGVRRAAGGGADGDEPAGGDKSNKP
jgi:hypothetical protein